MASSRSPVVSPTSTIASSISTVVSTSTMASSRSTVVSPTFTIASSRSTVVFPTSIIASSRSTVVSPTSTIASSRSTVVSPTSTIASLRSTVVFMNASSKTAVASAPSTASSTASSPSAIPSCIKAAMSLTSTMSLSSPKHTRTAFRSYSTQVDDGDTVLTHLDQEGRARMVNVSEKAVTSRVAEAECSLRVGARLLRLLHDARLPKGDALTVAQVAGVMGAKRTSDLIPLCHPLPLDCVRVNIVLPKGECNDGGDIKVNCEVRVTSRTGVEMEALTGAAVAALALYDMCKSVDKHMKVMNLRVVRKSGGRSGEWPRPAPPADLKLRAHDTSPIKPDETFAPTNIMHF